MFRQYHDNGYLSASSNPYLTVGGGPGSCRTLTHLIHRLGRDRGPYSSGYHDGGCCLCNGPETDHAQPWARILWWQPPPNVHRPTGSRCMLTAQQRCGSTAAERRRFPLFAVAFWNWDALKSVRCGRRLLTLRVIIAICMHRHVRLTIWHEADQTTPCVHCHGESEEVQVIRSACPALFLLPCHVWECAAPVHALRSPGCWPLLSLQRSRSQSSQQYELCHQSRDSTDCPPTKAST